LKFCRDRDKKKYETSPVNRKKLPFFYQLARNLLNKGAKEFCMKKQKVFLLLLVCLMAFGLAFTSCGNGTTSGGSSGDSDVIVPGSTLAEKMSWLQANTKSNSSYIIELNADMSSDTMRFVFNNRSNITVTIRGIGANRTIDFLPVMYGNLVVVGTGVTLVLDNNVTLKGDNKTFNQVVIVDGTLVMNNGSTITGNMGEGVAVSGTFNMNGGTISGNSSSIGAGVSVSGTFNMRGGTITGNSAQQGGGVSVSGTFNMTGGTITGNTADGYGGGVDVWGIFNKTGGTISGNTASTLGGVNYGKEVYAHSSSGEVKKYKETPASPSVNLSFNAKTGAFSGAWDS
jgi:hypothetical protein